MTLLFLFAGQLPAAEPLAQTLRESYQTMRM